MKDIRSTTPNISERRRSRFKVGFNEGAAGHGYKERALARLTWQNLGNRFGSIIGPAEEAAIDELYDLCVSVQAAEIDDE